MGEHERAGHLRHGGVLLPSRLTRLLSLLLSLLLAVLLLAVGLSLRRAIGGWFGSGCWLSLMPPNIGASAFGRLPCPPRSPAMDNLEA